ncbi:MAG: serine/threonine-protein kinase [Pirellulales bacterium]
MPGQYKLSDEPVPGYRLSEFLGRGGFGEVWKATAPGGTEAALKIISLSGKQGLKEFQALGLVKRIRHPNLVPIVAYWLKDQAGNVLDDAEADLDQLRKLVSSSATLKGTMMLDPKMQARPVELIIAMGLGEQDLYARLEECQRDGLEGIPQKELLGYMEDAARAIDYLNSPRHNLGAGLAAVQHCDIKPFNIMIVGGAAQVCDFGLARMLGDVRKTATAAGTIAYVAPECLTKNEPSSATDQYSLAVTYVELKTGKLPYDSEIYTEVVNAIVEGKLDLSMLSEAERSVIERATAVDPAERYRSTVDMIGDLRRAVESGAMPAARAPRRRSGAWLPLAFGVFSLGALAGWYFWPEPETFDPDNGGKLVVENGGQEDPPKDTDRLPVDGTTTDVEPEDGHEPATQAVLALAKNLVQQERYDEAINHLKPLLSGAKLEIEEEFEAYLLRGTCHLEKKHYAAAIADLTEAIGLDVRDARGDSRRDEAFLLRGTCYFEKALYKDAIADLSDAIDLNPDPNDVRAYSRRGLAYFHDGQLDRAIADFTTALDIAPSEVDYINRGKAYDGKEDLDSLDKAIDDFTNAITQNSASTEALFSRGLSYLAKSINPKTDALRRKDDLGRAIRDFEAVERLDPIYPDLAAMKDQAESLMAAP